MVAKNERPSLEKVIGLSVVGLLYNTSEQHDGLHGSGPTPSVDVQLKAHSNITKTQQFLFSGYTT